MKTDKGKNNLADYQALDAMTPEDIDRRPR
jgi:hypothetical protein